MMLSHGVQCATVLEPLNLGLVESVGEFGVPCRPVLRVYPQCHRLTNGKFGAHQVNLVIWIDLIVVGRLNER